MLILGVRYKLHAVSPAGRGEALTRFGRRKPQGLWAAKAAGAATGKTVDKCDSIGYLKDIYSEKTV